MILKVYRINKDNPLPGYMSQQASGIDLFASLEHDVSINPGEYSMIPTGIRVSFPRGYEAQVRPRSGLALKYGITVLNSPGTIDADYRGEVKVLLINHGVKPFIVRNMMRIAQMVISEVVNARVVEVEDVKHMDETKRHDGGFGHTGV
jgi:dUTP pyrophosphatase